LATEVGATPDGGAVLSLRDANDNHVVLAWVDTNGTLTATASPSFNGGTGETQLDIDGNGLAVLSATVGLNGCEPADPSSSCAGIEIQLFDHGTTVADTSVHSSTASSIRLPFGGLGDQDVAPRIINGGIVLWAQSYAGGTTSTYTDSLEVVPLPLVRQGWRDPTS
jgi:hypothetical protein